MKGIATAMNESENFGESDKSIMHISSASNMDVQCKRQADIQPQCQEKSQAEHSLVSESSAGSIWLLLNGFPLVQVQPIFQVQLRACGVMQLTPFGLTVTAMEIC